MYNQIYTTCIHNYSSVVIVVYTLNMIRSFVCLLVCFSCYFWAFSSFFPFVMEKNLNQCRAWGAPVCWAKYTTLLPHLPPVVRFLFTYFLNQNQDCAVFPFLMWTVNSGLSIFDHQKLFKFRWVRTCLEK